MVQQSLVAKWVPPLLSNFFHFLLFPQRPLGTNLVRLKIMKSNWEFENKLWVGGLILFSKPLFVPSSVTTHKMG